MKVGTLFGAMGLLLGGLTAAHADEPSLADQLKQLEMPANTAPAGVSNEKLYAVQTRYSPLRNRFELSVFGGKNLTGDSFLSSQDAGLGVRYHLTDRWSFALEGSKVFNSLTGAGDRLLEQEQLLPDSAYAKYRADLTATFNVFYGKFRLSMDKVFYFDQYVSLGAGMVGLQSGSEKAAVGDIGFAFWWGRKASMRIGLKDHYYNEKRTLSSGMAHNVVGHLSFGWMLGGNG